MNQLIALIVLTASTTFASSPLEVSLGARTSLETKKSVRAVVVRDPSLLAVTTTEDVALEGKKSGVTSVTVTYADGEVEQTLVVVGDGINADGMSGEKAQRVDVKGARR
ncbi:MAG: pilus assembly protein N-terminal domain-containing protein [Myxococcaceae bacterium]|nr:pilus assembly protein N-terminal domain-containing protein [Myxococcaceae bacterium]